MQQGSCEPPTDESSPGQSEQPLTGTASNSTIKNATLGKDIVNRSDDPPSSGESRKKHSTKPTTGEASVDHTIKRDVNLNVTERNDVPNDERGRPGSTRDETPGKREEIPPVLFRYAPRPENCQQPKPQRETGSFSIRNPFRRSKSCNERSVNPNTNSAKRGWLPWNTHKDKKRDNNEPGSLARSISEPAKSPRDEPKRDPETSPVAGEAHPSLTDATNAAQPLSLNSVADCLDDASDSARRDSAGSVGSQRSDGGRRETGESGYASGDEGNYISCYSNLLYILYIII